MSKRLLALMFAAALATATNSSAAFAAATPDSSAAGFEILFTHEFADHMKESLSLTDIQMNQLEPVITARVQRVDAELAAMDAANKPDVAGFIEKYADIRNDFEIDVMKVLTLEQRSSWESFKAEVEDAMVGGGAARQLVALDSAVKLSDDQERRIKPLLAAAIQKKIDLFQEMTHSGYINIREKRQARRALDKLNGELETSISKILTVDQRNAWKSARSR